MLSLLALPGAFAADPPLTPTLLAEVDYRHFGQSAEGNSGFGVARLRPGLAIHPRPGVTGAAVIEWTGATPVILDAWAELTLNPSLSVVAGYSKGPIFASFRHEPVASMPFPDRSPVVGAFRVRRDAGVELLVRPPALPVEVIARVSNGSGTPLANDNDLPAGYLVADLVLGRARRGAAPETPGGLRLGAAVLVESVSERSAVAAVTPLGVAFAEPPTVVGPRRVAEAHAIGWAGPTRFTVEAAEARESRDGEGGGEPSTPHVSRGLTTEALWTVRGAPRQPGAAPRSDDGPAVELAARFDALDLGLAADGLTPVGARGGALSAKVWTSGWSAVALSGWGLVYDAPPPATPGSSGSWGLTLRGSLFWGRPAPKAAP